MHEYVESSLPMGIPHIHNIASQITSKFDFETFQSLQLTNIVIKHMLNHNWLHYLSYGVPRTIRNHIMRYYSTTYFKVYTQ